MIFVGNNSLEKTASVKSEIKYEHKMTYEFSSRINMNVNIYE